MRFNSIALWGLCTVLVASSLSACGDAPSDQEGDKVETQQESMTDDTASPQVASPATDGRIVVSSLPKISEPNACILPITITNGTETETTVSMMEFSVTGSGQDDSGNMFAQTVAPGETNTARLLFPTRQCEELTVITAPNLTCENGESDCTEAVEFEAVDGLIIQRG